MVFCAYNLGNHVEGIKLSLNVLAKPRVKINMLNLAIEEGILATIYCSAIIPGKNYADDNANFTWSRGKSILNANITDNHFESMHQSLDHSSSF